MTLRKATAEDVPSILELIHSLAEYEKAPQEVIVTAQDLLDNGFGSHPEFKTIICEDNNEVVGMALYFYKFSTWKGKVMHLEDLIVKQDMRGRGFGKALLDEIVRIAKQENLKRVDWQVLDWNKPAVDLYESLGAEIQKEWWNCRLEKDNLLNYE